MASPASWEFSTTQRIVFGRGTLSQVGGIVRSLGTTALVVHDGDASRTRPLTESLTAAGVAHHCFVVVPEPTIEQVERGRDAAVMSSCDVVVSFGGGSCVDTGKAVAALVTNRGMLTDYLEVIGRGDRLIVPPLPHVVVPTTAGTGSEATKNAVVCSPQHGVKVSLRSDWLLPRVALVDPLLTVSCPPKTTRDSGLDALTQCVEPFTSNCTSPITDGLCREGVARAARSLERAVSRGDDVEAREDMCVASLIGGIALANAKLGLVHGFAGPLGGMISAPHGALCAAMLAPVLGANVRRLVERGEGPGYLLRYAELASLAGAVPQGHTADAAAEAVCFVHWIESLCKRLKVPSLRELGLTEDRVEELVTKALKASSTKGNCVSYTADELKAIVLSVF